MHRIELCQQTFYLHPFHAIYWEEQQTLLLADLHLGKAAHFRKGGLPVPATAGDSNWDRLQALLFDIKPARVLFLGDLFHSDYNPVWEELGDLIQQFRAVSFELIPGNHDILEDPYYQSAGLHLHPLTLEIPPFYFTHHPQAEIPEGLYNLCGHIHPSVTLRGGARQSLRLPCFYFGEQQGILPAFGAFTGTANITVRAGDRVFVITSNEVVEVS
ncbi:MAG: ligase-associated DNA damage response endonuclease PdeM [Saprospiraceae bacterium]|nr:ligase-associated DNA damage response endonuclease PdeM [Saprospiraceae bacterium]